MINNSSIYIILNQFKNGHITEDEAVRLIEDLYNRNNYIPVFPSWPQITYTQQPSYKPFEVTCKQ